MGLEEVSVPGFDVAHPLGMPLDAHEPVLRDVAGLERLYHPVSTASGHRENVGQAFDPLMMVRVDLDSLTIRDLRQVGVVMNLDFVSDLAFGRRLPVVDDISAELRGHILIERAA